MFDRLKFGKRLREMRGDLSQGKFAKRLSSNGGYISRIEKGQRKPSLELLLSLKKVHGINLDSWITGDDILGDFVDASDSLIKKLSLEMAEIKNEMLKLKRAIPTSFKKVV